MAIDSESKLRHASASRHRVRHQHSTCHILRANTALKPNGNIMALHNTVGPQVHRIKMSWKLVTQRHGRAQAPNRLFASVTTRVQTPVFVDGKIDITKSVLVPGTKERRPGPFMVSSVIQSAAFKLL